MANKRYYWLKLKEDFFKSKEMKKLRKVAGGDTYVIIYLKLQLLSLKNDGKLYFEGVDDDFVSELALELDEEIENVKMTLNFLLRCHLLKCVSQDEYFLPTIPEVTGSECSSASRMRKFRALQSDSDNDVTSNPSQCDTHALQSDKKVTTEKEIRDRDRDRDKSKRENIDYKKIVDMYNTTCVSLPAVLKLSESRKKTIKARFSNGYTYEDFFRLFQLAEKSAFLKGKNARNWAADFDWLIKDSNMAKTLEGKYNDNQNQNPQTNMSDMSEWGF